MGSGQDRLADPTLRSRRLQAGVPPAIGVKQLLAVGEELDNVSAYILTNATKRWPGIVDYPYMGLDGDTESMTREEFRRLMASLSVRDSPF